MFDMESEEEYAESYRRSNRIHELSRKRDSLTESDPLYPIIQMVLREADSLSAKDLYLFSAEVGLYEIEIANHEQGKRNAIEALEKNEVVREARRKQSEAEITRLEAMGFSPHYKDGGHWVERKVELDWD